LLLPQDHNEAPAFGQLAFYFGWDFRRGAAEQDDVVGRAPTMPEARGLFNVSHRPDVVIDQGRAADSRQFVIIFERDDAACQH
jgi:hypothetical protein